jgi:hypothetical protein
MRRLLWRLAAGLCLAPLMGLGLASASELVGTPASGPGIVPVVPVRPVGPKVVPVDPTKLKKIDKTEGTCGAHGTTIEFLDSPNEAATQAKKEGKLVFVLHVSGHLEDPRFL